MGGAEGADGGGEQGAFAELQPRNTRLRQLARHPSFNGAPEEITLQALAAFRDDGKRYILTVDDLHTMQSDATLKLLPVFCGRLPEGFTLLCLSRSGPPDVFADLILKNELAVISAEKLYFSSAEIKTLFDRSDRPITEQQAAEILKATGGWAIGLRALLMSGKDTYDIKLTSDYLEAFLTQHVWEKWNQKTREHLKKASVVSDLTPELFSALTGARKGADALAALTRKNHLLSVGGGTVFTTFSAIFSSTCWSGTARNPITVN
ncbi:MAG: hypothetical protein FWG72_10700 [Oscillospiraceae bacterium]|nr:hypothetical protein [Oscillospiraceae bacterium]